MSADFSLVEEGDVVELTARNRGPERVTGGWVAPNKTAFEGDKGAPYYSDYWDKCAVIQPARGWKVGDKVRLVGGGVGVPQGNPYDLPCYRGWPGLLYGGLVRVESSPGLGN